MKQGYLNVLVWLLIPLSCFSQPENINISSTSAFEGEPSLAVNPVNTKNIVIGWMALDLSTGPGWPSTMREQDSTSPAIPIVQFRRTTGLPFSQMSG